MAATLWYVIVGAIFVLMALSSSLLKRLPLSTSLLYLLAGIAIGPAGLDLIRLDLIDQAPLLERLTEIVVLISLFTAGLKLRARLRDRSWRIPVRLASVAMLITVGLIAVVGVYGLGLPLGVAVLLGAVLAPTDPVLASDVQLEHPDNRDRLRFGLTGEAGLNDGTAFPMVMLGLGLMGLHELGQAGWRWFTIDVLWAVSVGLLAGWLLGTVVGKLVVYLRREHREAVGLDDFLGLGLIALSYGVAHALHVYGFLAVFAAGLALRHIELDANGHELPKMGDLGAADVEEIATAPETAPTYMAQAVLGFNEQLERMGEVAMAVALGVILVPLLPAIPYGALWFLPVLFFVIRPVSAAASLLRSDTTGLQRVLIGWFGIRGIGSLYYLTYALNHGFDGPLATQIVALTVITVAVSIVIHGISVTPIMKRYSREEQQTGPATAPEGQTSA